MRPAGGAPRHRVHAHKQGPRERAVQREARQGAAEDRGGATAEERPEAVGEGARTEARTETVTNPLVAPLCGVMPLPPSAALLRLSKQRRGAAENHVPPQSGATREI